MNPKTMSDEELIKRFATVVSDGVSFNEGCFVEYEETEEVELEQEILRRMSAGAEERKP